MKYIFKTSETFILSAILSGLLLVGFPQGAGTKERYFPLRQFMDSRHDHNRLYPAKGQFLEVLPQGNREVFWGKERYHFFNGVWYRPMGKKFLVVSPPFGLTVPFLPPFHSTFWVNTIPYYYANEVYYTQSPIGYVIVEPPKGEVGQTPPGNRFFIYPRQNQSEETQRKDRLECQSWAKGQTDYNPDRPLANMTETQKTQRQGEFQRAMGACLEGRGYAVK